jgi:hypothetical protein
VQSAVFRNANGSKLNDSQTAVGCALFFFLKLTARQVSSAAQLSEHSTSDRADLDAVGWSTAHSKAPETLRTEDELNSATAARPLPHSDSAEPTRNEHRRKTGNMSFFVVGWGYIFCRINDGLTISCIFYLM